MKILFPLLATALAAPGLCLADPAPGPAPDTPQVVVADYRAVAPLVVDAARLPTFETEVPDIQVIDRTEIDARQAVYAADILDTAPGLAVTRDGAFGGVTSVRMRGASSDKTLVLIDGVPQNDASDPNGAYDFANLDLANVERIEILSGPQSSLWGSDAIGGVISLTTREENGWRAAVEGGSLDTFDGSAAAGRRTDSWAAGLSVSGYRSDGVSKADGFPERDPYASWNVGGYGRVDVGANVVVDGRIAYDDSRADTDGYNAAFMFGDTPEYATYRSWTGDVRAVIDDPWGFKDTLSLGGYSLDRAALGNVDPTLNSRFAAAQQDYRWTSERGAPTDPFGVEFGAERTNDRGSLSTGSSLSLGTTSGFVVARATPLAPLTLTGSVRYDAPDTFSGQATGHASAVWRLPAGFSLEGAWGQGFKTPTISEIFCDFCDPGSATPLRPEHAEGWDGALAWRSGDGRFSAKVTAYRLAVGDQIEFTDAPPFHYVNIDRTRTNGVETEVDARLTTEFSLHAEYAYTDAVDLDTGAQMLRVPRNAGSVSLAWARGRWQADLTVRSEGQDADIDPSTFIPTDRPGFVLANIAGSYALTPRLQLTARIEDIGDTHYQEALGYGEPRRGFFFGIRAKG